MYYYPNQPWVLSADVILNIHLIRGKRDMFWKKKQAFHLPNYTITVHLDNNTLTTELVDSRQNTVIFIMVFRIKKIFRSLLPKSVSVRHLKKLFSKLSYRCWIFLSNIVAVETLIDFLFLRDSFLFFSQFSCIFFNGKYTNWEITVLHGNSVTLRQEQLHNSL